MAMTTSSSISVKAAAPQGRAVKPACRVAPRSGTAPRLVAPDGVGGTDAPFTTGAYLTTARKNRPWPVAGTLAWPLGPLMLTPGTSLHTFRSSEAWRP